MGYKQIEICIISDQHIRAKTIRLQIQSVLDEPCNILITGSAEPFEIGTNIENQIFLVDLMSINEPASQIINTLKALNNQAKIIALHIYRSSFLVRPLFRLGINGYVYYEPSRKDLLSAIEQVAAGKNYIPLFQPAG